MTSQPIPNGSYIIKYGADQGVGGEYVTGGVPGTVLTTQAPDPYKLQAFDVRYDSEKKAYTFRDPDPRGAGISSEKVEAGQPVLMERPLYFHIVPVAYQLIVAEGTDSELAVARSRTQKLYLDDPKTSDSVWQLKYQGN